MRGFTTFVEAILSGFVVYEFAGQPENSDWVRVGTVASPEEGLALASARIQQPDVHFAMTVTNHEDDGPRIVNATYATGRRAKGTGKTFRRIQQWNGGRSIDQASTAMIRMHGDGSGVNVFHRHSMPRWFDLVGRTHSAPINNLGRLLQRDKGFTEVADGFWVLRLTRDGWRVYERYDQRSQYFTAADAVRGARDVVTHFIDETRPYDRSLGYSSHIYPYKTAVAVAVRDGRVQVLQQFIHASMSTRSLASGPGVHNFALEIRDDMVGRYVPPKVLNHPEFDTRQMGQEELQRFLMVPIIAYIDGDEPISTDANYVRHPDWPDEWPQTKHYEK